MNHSTSLPRQPLYHVPSMLGTTTSWILLDGRGSNDWPRREKKMLRMINQAKLRSFRRSPKYMYGYEVPRDYKHAMELDKKNGNTSGRMQLTLK